MVMTWDGVSWSMTAQDAVGPPPQNQATFLAAVTVAGDAVWATGARYSLSGEPYGGLRPLARVMCPVRVTDSGFAEGASTGASDQAVTWAADPTNASSRVLADASGMDLFRSREIPAGGLFTFAYPGAGTYRVLDEPTGDLASVRLPPRAVPRRGEVDESFTIQWAPIPSTGEATFHVAVERPGSAGFSSWYVGPLVRQEFTPDGGSGTYRFRVRSEIGGVSSRWSPPISIQADG